MSHPLIDRLTSKMRWPHLSTKANRDACIAADGLHVAFIPGDPTGNLATADVAVIWPEPRLAVQNAVDRVVVDDATETGTLTKVFKAPSPIFVGDGQPICTLPRVHDWADYMARIPHTLSAPMPVGAE